MHISIFQIADGRDHKLDLLRLAGFKFRIIIPLQQPEHLVLDFVDIRQEKLFHRQADKDRDHHIGDQDTGGQPEDVGSDFNGRIRPRIDSHKKNIRAVPDHRGGSKIIAQMDRCHFSFFQFLQFFQDPAPPFFIH